MNRLPLSLFLAVMIACAPVAAVSSGIIIPDSGGPKVVSIGQARALPLGTVVTIEGVITVPPGAFKSSLLDEGFAIQDSSGGIYVRLSRRTGWRRGRRVQVTGKLADSNGLLTIAPSDASSVRARGMGQEVQPELTETGKVGETTEGLLVKVKGTITKGVVDDLPYGFRLFLDDGTGEIQIYVSASTKVNRRGLRTGALAEVTGFSGQYKDHYEVNPRFQADILVKQR